MSSPIQTSTEQTSRESAAVTNPEQQGSLCGRVIRVVRECGNAILEKILGKIIGIAVRDVLSQSSRLGAWSFASTPQFYVDSNDVYSDSDDDLYEQFSVRKLAHHIN